MSCCSNCANVTKYICLTCERPVCNKSSDCSVWADEENPGWKAGVAVAWCLPCFDKRNAPENLIGDEELKEEEPVNRPEQQVNQIQESPQVETASSSSKAKKKARQATNDGQSRKCLPLSEKVQVIRASQSTASHRVPVSGLSCLSSIQVDCSKSSNITFLKCIPMQMIHNCMCHSAQTRALSSQQH